MTKEKEVDKTLVKCNNNGCLHNENGFCIAEVILIDNHNKCQGDYVIQ